MTVGDSGVVSTADWKEVRLKFVASLPRMAVDGAEEYVGLEHVESGTGQLMSTGDPAEMAGDGLSAAPGDVLFGKLRPYLGKVWHADRHVACSSEFAVVRASTAIDSKFLAYVLLDRRFIGEMDATTYGARMPRVSREDIGEYELLLPHIERQRAIASSLDRETARIDRLVEKKRRLLDLLEEKRTALITQAVTRGLDPDVPMKDSGVEWIGEIPEHWDVAKIKHVARMESGHTPNRQVAEYWDGGVGWISLADSKRLKGQDVILETEYEISDAGLANSSARLLPKGAVAFSRDASIGLCALLGRRMAVSQHFIAWVCSDRIRPEYLLLVLKSMNQELDRLTMGATIRTLGLPDVGTLRTPIPPTDRQDEIVADVKRQSERLRKLARSISNAVATLHEYRSALISAAVTGEMRVLEARQLYFGAGRVSCWCSR